MIPATQIKKGMVIIHNGELHQVVSFHHVTPGNWRGMVQTKLRNLKTGSLIENRFRSEDRIDRAVLEQHEMEYLYQDGDQFCFMNTATYEQVFLTKETIEDTLPFLKSNTKIVVDFHEGSAISIAVAAATERHDEAAAHIGPQRRHPVEVVETEPGIKGATATRATKPATLETGLVVQVPVFIERGDRIRVDTSDKKYIERANK